MDFSAYKEALEAAGFEIDANSHVFAFTKNGEIGRYWLKPNGRWGDEAESILRAAVLEVAPGSFVLPTPSGLYACPRTLTGGHLTGISDQRADSYPMAWLEALKALHDSGVFWKEGGR